MKLMGNDELGLSHHGPGVEIEGGNVGTGVRVWNAT